LPRMTIENVQITNCEDIRFALVPRECKPIYNNLGPKYSKETIWPDGFDPETIGAKLEL